MKSTWVQGKKQGSLRSRVLAFFSLLLLILLLDTIPCYAAVLYGKSSRHKAGPASGMSAFKPQSGFKGKNNAAKDGDGIFGGDKRRVYTGPNPLHNR
ncbi:hypothetical protein SLA2020_149510 [Shorea laevis]